MKKLVNRFCIAVMAGGLLFVSAPRGVHAASAGPGVCAGDVEKLCKDVQPGGGAIMKCLKEHEGELAAACKEHLAGMEERRNKARGACREDVERFCKDVQPRGGGIVKCLREHETELSSGCRETFGQGQGKRGQN